MKFNNRRPTFVIHPTLILFFVIALVTGTFIQFAIIIAIVFMHECGHFLAAKWFNWRINAVILWAFGGVMATDEDESRPLKEEVIVTLSGPLQHVIIFGAVQLFHWFGIMSDYLYETAILLNSVIFLFNLLPIYPLDGGKLLKVSLSGFLPFRKSYQFSLLFSMLVCLGIIILQLTVLPFTFTAFFIMAFLLLELFRYWKHEYFTFIRFLLHRTAHGKNAKKTGRIFVTDEDRFIDVFNRFKKNVYYYVYITPEFYVSETDFLQKFFYGQPHDLTVREVYLKR